MDNDDGSLKQNVEMTFFFSIQSVQILDAFSGRYAGFD